MSLNKAHKFKQRVLTALILAPLVMIGIFLLPKFEFALITAIVLAIAGWEWSRLIGFTAIKKQALYVLILLLALFVAQKIFPALILIIAMVWWLAALYLVVHYPQSARYWAKRKIISALMGLCVLVPCWVGMNMIRDKGAIYLLLAFFLVWSADTGAFFIGRSWGKHKLAPRVSPGKTMEGLLGGLALTLIAAILAGLLMKVSLLQWSGLLLLAIIIALASVLGDLFESMMKREAGVKDSGNWLPGHGGLLDRIDGLTIAMPVFALGMALIGL